MRLFLISHSAGLLGAERCLLEIVAGAREAGHAVVVAMPDDGPLRARCEAMGARCIVVPTRSWMGPRHRWAALGLVRLLQARLSRSRYEDVVRSAAPDVVITNSAVLPVGAWVAERLHLPHVWIVRESLVTNPQLRSVLPKRYIARTILAKSAVVLAVSDYVRDQLVSVSGLSPTHVLPIRPRPVASLPDRPPGRPKSAGSLELVLPGYISREKGQFIAVRALRTAVREHPGIRLSIVGTGSRGMLLLLRACVAVSGVRRNVHFRGWVDDMQAVYRQSDAVLMASRHEAFGRTTLEALLEGLPVIAFDSGGSSEILRFGGGRLVRPFTAAALGEAMAAYASMGPAEWAARQEEVLSAAGRHVSAPAQYRYLLDALQRATSRGAGAA